MLTVIEVYCFSELMSFKKKSLLSSKQACLLNIFVTSVWTRICRDHYKDV